MRAVCPVDSSHVEFITPIHVMQDVRVTAEGGFIEEIATLEMTHGPNPGNIWECANCGAEAEVTEN